MPKNCKKLKSKSSFQGPAASWSERDRGGTASADLLHPCPEPACRVVRETFICILALHRWGTLKRTCFLQQENPLHCLLCKSAALGLPLSYSVRFLGAADSPRGRVKLSWGQLKKEAVSICASFLLHFNFALNTFPFWKDELSNALQWQGHLQNKHLLTKTSLSAPTLTCRRW